MGVVRIIAAASALLAFAAAARAADMPEIVQQPALAIHEFGSNWYLRGDIGYRVNGLAGRSEWNGFAVDNIGIADAFVFGAGVGVKMGWLRVDATADYGLRAAYRGSVPGVADFTAGIDALALLINAYADLGTWRGFTPYVGAGVGTALVGTMGVVNSALPPGSGGGGLESWNLAWALMAGVGYNLAPNLLIDVGYRYIHLGNAATPVDQLGAALAVRGLSANEVRVGVRYTVD